jgi:general stress protein 26
MSTDELLAIAREIISKVPSCMAITVDESGEAHARVVNVKALSEDWTVRFTTSLRSRKAMEIAATGRLTLAYQYDQGNAYVTLAGKAKITRDLDAMTRNWRPDSYTWYPGGPSDPNVVYVDFVADRVELWSTPHGVVPDPRISLWAAVLLRKGKEWREQTTLPPGE